LPQAAADKLAAACARAMHEKDAVDRLVNDASLAVGNSPAEFTAFIEREQKRWQPVIARARIKPD
jgi:tripartite-type tricarboxylate transporter receptor subunit TctC